MMRKQAKDGSGGGAPDVEGARQEELSYLCPLASPGGGGWGLSRPWRADGWGEIPQTGIFVLESSFSLWGFHGQQLGRGGGGSGASPTGALVPPLPPSSLMCVWGGGGRVTGISSSTLIPVRGGCWTPWAFGKICQRE